MLWHTVQIFCKVKRTNVLLLFQHRCLQVSKPREESTPRRGALTLLSLRHRAVSKSKSSRTILPHRHRWLGKSPLTVLQTSRVGTKSPAVHQLALNFSLCAPRSARPLLSCHPSCPDAPRCPLVAIQLFILLFLSPLLSQSGCVSYMIAERFKGGDQASPPYTLRVPDSLCDVSPSRIVSQRRIQCVRTARRGATKTTGLSFPLFPVGSDSSPQ